jgi:hypothetical protein
VTAERLAPSLLPQPGTDHVAAGDLARQHAPSASVGGTIYLGTSGIQRGIIAAELGILQ